MIVKGNSDFDSLTITFLLTKVENCYMKTAVF
jgi:hypothetical protein